MPLPLPNLDTRRWDDLVAEGRSLIPRYAPAWTDHNIHDPGITLLELFAWLVEHDIYRVNRVPDRHRLKFLSLIGFSPRPPRPARTALTFNLADGMSAQQLPAGIVLASDSGAAASASLRFRTISPLTVLPARLQAVQVFDGAQLSDQTLFWRERLAFNPWGANPQSVAASQKELQPALYLGFNEALPQGVETTLWLWFAGSRSGLQQRARITDEACEKGCHPWWYPSTCPPHKPADDFWCSSEDFDAQPSSQSSVTETLPKHHSVRAVWDYYDGSAWQALDPAKGQVLDDTRGFTLDGAVSLKLPGLMGQQSLGTITDSLFYLRCRLASGRPDAAPALRDVALNTVAVEQCFPIQSTFSIAPGVSPGTPPVPGTPCKLSLSLDGNGVITALETLSADAQAPAALVLGYLPATSSVQGELSITMSLIGFGSGQPWQQVVLPDAPVSQGRAQVWTIGSGGMQEWRGQMDLDASAGTDADFMCDAASGLITFGSGERGRVVDEGDAIVASYDVTVGAAGNAVAAGTLWSLSDPDSLLNRALLQAEPLAVSSAFESIANHAAPTVGADEEEISHAAGRAAANEWAHERLAELGANAPGATLDQLERADVLDREAPRRATTLLDFERLALDVPGTRIARARAWAGIDPAYSCLSAPGTVTLVVVPELPLGRPQPTPGLLRAVHCYLDCRRVICTRLVVVGPQYLRVSVRARVRASQGASAARVRERVLASLNHFLDPLEGGPNGRGWPFGRDVYRSEILQVIDGTQGVNHVLDMELIADDKEALCGNVCVGAIWLVTPGVHSIEVV